MTNDLQIKIEHSIDIIRRSERLAMVMQPDNGFFIGFSGGKDSQVVLELCKMAGVKFRAVYSPTTNDPADNVRFIKQHYPSVIFDKPKKSFLQLVREKGLPTRKFRFCCAILKEGAGVGNVVITGIRRQESRKRSQYPEFERFGKQGKTLEEMTERNFECVNGKDKFMLRPILEWTENDVWQFITIYNLPINPCYSSNKRVGCVMCPFAPKRQLIKVKESYPKLYKALLHALQDFIDKKNGGGYFATAEEYFDWWVSKQSVKVYKEKQRQLQIFEK